jgi:hypothetical protein
MGGVDTRSFLPRWDVALSYHARFNECYPPFDLNRFNAYDSAG